MFSLAPNPSSEIIPPPWIGGLSTTLDSVPMLHYVFVSEIGQLACLCDPDIACYTVHFFMRTTHILSHHDVPPHTECYLSCRVLSLL